jgi:Ca2+-binding RTX toxin-like protein
VLALAASVLFAPYALAATEERITRDHDGDWHMRHHSCGGSAEGTQRFLPGPVGLPGDSKSGGPPQDEGDPETPNTGSLEVALNDNDNSLEENRNTRYGGLPLAQVSQIFYWTYVRSVPFPPPDELPAVYLGLEIDTNGDSTSEETLIFEPNMQEDDGQHDVTIGEWQRWVAKDLVPGGPEGLWYQEDAPGTLLSLQAWAALLPAGSRIVNPTTLDGVTAPEVNGGVFLAAGCTTSGTDWSGFSGNVDAVTIVGTGSSLTYDFEPESPGRATRLQCTPEEAVNSAGRGHTISCIATNDDGNRVADVLIDAEAVGDNSPDGDTPTSPDFGCETESDDPTTPTTNEAGRCQFRHGPGGQGSTVNVGTTTYYAWIDEDGVDDTVEADRAEGPSENQDPGGRPEGDGGDDTDVMVATWTPVLDCLPETIALIPGSGHTATCSVRDGASNPLSGRNVDIEATGVNDPDAANSPLLPDFFCTTDANGLCPFTHPAALTTATGRTTYRAWVDLDNNDATFEGDSAEALSSTGGKAEPDDTDVVEVNWSTTGGTPTPTPGCPTPSPSGASPTPCPTPTNTATPTPTPSRSPSPTPTPTTSPHGCAGDPDAITGTPGNDILVGTSGDDTICGFGGDDTIRGRGGDDRIKGGRGDDVIKGGGGNDDLSGGAGNDQISGNRGLDFLQGKGGNDVLAGGRGRDGLAGGRGNDSLDGGRGRDVCGGGPGRDTRRRCEAGPP